MRILLVENDEQLRRHYRTVLQFAGFEVQDTSDGLHALRALDEQPPDLVVLDVALPTINGMTVQLEAHARQIPIIVLATESSGPAANSARVLRKPVSPERLVTEVHRCLTGDATP